MHYFFNYFSIGFIIFVILIVKANLNTKLKDAKAELIPQNSKNPYKNNVYVRAHNGMLNDIEEYEYYIKKAISKGKPQSEIDAMIKEEKPNISRNVREYLMETNILP